MNPDERRSHKTQGPGPALWQKALATGESGLGIPAAQRLSWGQRQILAAETRRRWDWSEQAQGPGGDSVPWRSGHTGVSCSILGTTDALE